MPIDFSPSSHNIGNAFNPIDPQNLQNTEAVQKQTGKEQAGNIKEAKTEASLSKKIFSEPREASDSSRSSLKNRVKQLSAENAVIMPAIPNPNLPPQNAASAA